MRRRARGERVGGARGRGGRQAGEEEREVREKEATVSKKNLCYQLHSIYFRIVKDTVNFCTGMVL